MVINIGLFKQSNIKNINVWIS